VPGFGSAATYSCDDILGVLAPRS